MVRRREPEKSDGKGRNEENVVSCGTVLRTTTNAKAGR
jgi:hypothetical protein